MERYCYKKATQCAFADERGLCLMPKCKLPECPRCGQKTNKEVSDDQATNAR